jgi:hypothetical protein
VARPRIVDGVEHDDHENLCVLLTYREAVPQAD